MTIKEKNLFQIIKVSHNDLYLNKTANPPRSQIKK
jgi:hypothetical protein